MQQKGNLFLMLLLAGFLMLLLAGAALASPAFLNAFQLTQPRNSRPQQSPQNTSSSDAAQVVIHREALKLTSPKTYQAPLQLEAARSLKIAASADGIVRKLHFQAGEMVGAQSEVARLDNSEQQLLVQRASANYRATQIELKRAEAQNDSDLAQLAQARMEAAKAELDLAELRNDRTILRAPFDGKVFRVYATEGKVTEAGEPLLLLGDDSRLQAEIPLDRENAEQGGSVSIQVEGTTVEATIEKTFPLAKRFEPLRDLSQSVTSALVVIDNKEGRFQVGQAVYVPLIPRQPVTEIPTAAIDNTENGQRKVQVVRRNFVRDIPVRLLGQVGEERVHVCGPFSEGDEVILEASQQLPDGTQVRPNALAGSPSGQGQRRQIRTKNRPANSSNSQSPDF